MLAVFVWQGHRWAIIAAMLLWTADKGAQVYEQIDNGGHLGATMCIPWEWVGPPR